MSSQPTSGWSWPKDFGTTSSHHEVPLPGTFTDDEPQVPRQPTEQSTHNLTKTPPQEPEESAARARKPQKHYGPRTCRICLEVVQPTFEPPTEGFAFLNPTPKVSYISEDPESGQLIRPCKCKGSQRYCHEGCLQAWRHADPSYRSKNHWECPTCKTKYSLERIKWSRWISSTFMQLLLTISILVFAIFILGFVGDTIINLYLDPYSTITSGGQTLPIFPEDNGGGWTRHFLKGTTSLGLLGFVKVFFTNPWLNIRTMIFGPRVRRGNNGRDRLEDISWTLIIIGVLTFLAATFNWVRAWSRRTLEKAGERVLDVQGDDDDDED